MIHEFALDPRILNRWETYDRLVHDCGVEYGRLIANFPNRWKKMVWEAVSANPAVTPVESQRIEFHLQHRVESKLMAGSRRYDFADTDWLRQAEREHDGGKPFRAIVSDESPRGHADVIVAGELDRENDPRWRVARTESISRTAECLAEKAKPLFRISRAVRLVDPHFMPEAERYQRTIAALLAALRSINPQLSSVEIHLSVRKDSRTGVETPRFAFEQSCKARLARCVPAGIKLHLFRWRERRDGERLHARFILTDRAGIGIEGGLDAGRRGQTTDLFLLTPEQREKHWNDFNSSPPAGTGPEWCSTFEPELGGPIIVERT